jgi:hypothetical protein
MSHGERSTVHEFRSAPVVTGRMLLLEYALTAWIPVVCVREVLTLQQPLDEVIQLLFVAAITVFIMGWLTWSWLEFRRFGESVCRVSALPAAGAPSFEAEIECSLPLDSTAPVVVRLESRAALSKFPRPHWQIERAVDPREIRPLAAGRVIVPVRLDIPGGGATAGPSRAVWALKVARTRVGMDFHAEFTLPVMEAVDAAAGELMAH